MANGGWGGFGQAWGQSMAMDRRREEKERKKDRRNMWLMQLVGAPIAQGITESVKTAVAPSFEESISNYFRGEEGAALASKAIRNQNTVKDLETKHEALVKAGGGDGLRGLYKQYEEDFKSEEMSKYSDTQIGDLAPNKYLVDQLWNSQSETYLKEAKEQWAEIEEALRIARSAPDLATLTSRIKDSKYLSNRNLLVRPFKWIVNKVRRTDPELEKQQAYDYIVYGKNVIRGKDGEIDSEASNLGIWVNDSKFKDLVDKAMQLRDPKQIEKFNKEMYKSKEYQALNEAQQELMDRLAQKRLLHETLKGERDDLTSYQSNILQSMTEKGIAHTEINYEREIAESIHVPKTNEIPQMVEEFGMYQDNEKYINNLRQSVIERFHKQLGLERTDKYNELTKGNAAAVQAIDTKVNSVLATYMRLSTRAIEGAKLRAFEDGVFTPEQFKNSAQYSRYLFDRTLTQLLDSHTTLADVADEKSTSSIWDDLNIFGETESDIVRNYRVSDGRGLEDYVYKLLTDQDENTIDEASRSQRRVDYTRDKEEDARIAREKELENLSPEEREQEKLKGDSLGEGVTIGIDNVFSVDFRTLDPKDEDDFNNYILPIKRILTYSEISHTHKRKFIEAVQNKIYVENFEGRSATQIGTDQLAYVKGVEFRNLIEAENIFSPTELEILRQVYPQDPYKQGTPGDIKEYFGLPREPKNKIGVEENQRPESVPPQVYTEEELQRQLEEDPFTLMAPKRTSFQTNTPDVETGVGNVLDDDYRMDEVDFSSPEEQELRFGKVGEDIAPYVIKGKRREATALYKQIRARKDNMPKEELVDKIADVVLTDKEKADATAPVTTRPSLLSENQALAELDVTDKLTNVLTEKGLDMEAILIPFKEEEELKFGKVGRDINTQSILAPEETEEEIILAPPNKRTEIDSAIDSVQSVFNDPAHVQTFMRRIAAVESAKGEHSKTYQIRNDGFGPYQMTKSTFVDLLNRINGREGYGKTKIQKWIEPIKKELGIDITQVKFEEMVDPVVSTVMARLQLLSKTPAIPKDLSGQADYWKTKWNSESPLAKGTRRQFVRESNYYERAKN